MRQNYPPGDDLENRLRTKDAAPLGRCLCCAMHLGLGNLQGACSHGWSERRAKSQTSSFDVTVGAATRVTWTWTRRGSLCRPTCRGRSARLLGRCIRTRAAALRTRRGSTQQEMRGKLRRAVLHVGYHGLQLRQRLQLQTPTVFVCGRRLCC